MLECLSISTSAEEVLNQYLSSIQQHVGSDERERKLREDEILRAVHFLYGKTLEGALAIVDANAVTRLVSLPSNRSCYLVRASAAYSTKKSKRDQPTNLSSNESYYLCIVPSGSRNELSFHYCSCRSFSERTRGSACGLCKHLLAIRLLSALDQRPNISETISDDAFAKLLLQRVIS